MSRIHATDLGHRFHAARTGGSTRESPTPGLRVGRALAALTLAALASGTAALPGQAPAPPPDPLPLPAPPPPEQEQQPERPDPEPAARIRLAVTTDGRVVYAGRVVGIDGLGAVLRRALGDKPLPVVVTTAADAKGEVDPEQWAALVRAVDQAKRAGAQRVTIDLPTDGDLASLEDLDRKPRAVLQPAPELTPALRRLGPGTVDVLLVVDITGRVEQARVYKATDPAFEEPALAAIRQWRFEPGIREGRPVRVRLRVPVRFPGR